MVLPILIIIINVADESWNTSRLLAFVKSPFERRDRMRDSQSLLRGIVGEDWIYFGVVRDRPWELLYLQCTLR